MHSGAKRHVVTETKNTYYSPHAYRLSSHTVTPSEPSSPQVETRTIGRPLQNPSSFNATTLDL